MPVRTRAASMGEMSPATVHCGVVPAGLRAPEVAPVLLQCVGCRAPKECTVCITGVGQCHEDMCVTHDRDWALGMPGGMWFCPHCPLGACKCPTCRPGIWRAGRAGVTSQPGLGRASGWRPRWARVRGGCTGRQGTLGPPSLRLRPAAVQGGSPEAGTARCHCGRCSRCVAAQRWTRSPTASCAGHPAA